MGPPWRGTVAPVLSRRGPNLGAKIGMQQAIWPHHCGPETLRCFLGNRFIRVVYLEPYIGWGSTPESIKHLEDGKCID